MNEITRTRLAVLAITTVVAGCNKNAPPVALEDYCDRYAAITCDAAEDCDCITPPATYEMCVAIMLGECRDDVDAGVATGRYAYNPQAGGDCLRAVDRIIADCVIDIEDALTSLVACDGVLVGIVPVGQACDSTSECERGLECFLDSCTAMPGNGDACLTGYACADDLFCGDDALCHAPRGGGAACPEGDEACADDLYCEPESDTCQPYIGEGGDCADATWACADDLYCDAVYHACTRYPASGESCAGSYEECLDGLYCDDAFVCRPLLDEGALCNDDEECESDDCTEGTCQPIEESICSF